MMKKFFFRKEKGFTLIELLIVVAIIGIIAGIAIPRFLGARTKAKVTKAFADMANINTALEMYYVDNDEYPQNLEVTEGETALMDGDYISSIPDDPFGTAETPNYRYYVNDADDPTLWLIVSNGPDGVEDVAPVAAGFTASDTNSTVAGQLGGPDGAIPPTDKTYYGAGSGDSGWCEAKSSRDLGDIGRGGP